MDDDALRFRVAQLSTELQERTKWEALRLMEGIKQKEADVARKVLVASLVSRRLRSSLGDC